MANRAIYITIGAALVLAVLWASVPRSFDTLEVADVSDGALEDSENLPANDADEDQHQGASSEARTDSDSTLIENTAFGLVSDDVVGQVEPRMRERFFDGGAPEEYRRHRVLRIDTESLRNQLLTQYNQRTEFGSGGIESVVIPMFDDFSVPIEIHSWMESDLGVASAFGRVLLDGAGYDSAQFHFTSNGRLDSSIVLRDASFIIAEVGNNVYYMVMEIETIDSLIDHHH